MASEPHRPQFLNTGDPNEKAEPHPNRIGIYEIIREIGRGGMGVVYLARRQDSFAMQVALKVLKRGMDTEEVVRRFRRERQIMADLKHPNIASILDGGSTSDGRPYLVMEYVDGKHLVTYMDDNRLNLHDRLSLFLQVCEIVSFAHQNMIIHRDLKPANILVDQVGRIKLLDFGIASILSPDSGEALTQVNNDRMPFTPEYAAPEQVQGRRLTPACDVYALGVMLHQLLTGRRPYQTMGLDTFHAIQVICQNNLSKPSVSLERSDIPFDTIDGTLPDLEAVARARGLDRDRLKRRLEGDLDSILLKALEKSQKSRYPSVEQLAEDVRRHLAGIPILARPATRLYLVSRFMWRHRFKLGPITFFLILVLGFVGALNQQLQIARREQRRANQATEFLSGMFLDFDPAEGEATTIKAGDFLKLGVSRLETELRDDPEMRSQILITIGRTYLSLNKTEQAEALLKQARDIRVSLFGTEHLLVAEADHYLGKLASFQDNPTLAVSYLEAAVRIRSTQLGAKHADTISSKAALVRVYLETSHLEEATGMVESILKEETPKTISKEFLDTIELLAETYYRSGKIEKALQLTDYDLGLAREFYGRDHPQIGNLLSLKAVCLESLDRNEEADLAGTRAVEILIANYGRLHKSVGLALNKLAGIKASKGSMDEAEMLILEVCDINFQVLGENHMLSAKAMSNLALIKSQVGNYYEALELYQKVLAIYRGRDPLPLREIGINKMNQGWVYNEMGDFAQAYLFFSEAREYIVRSMGETHFSFGIIQVGLAQALYNSGSYSQALDLAEEAHQLLLTATNPDHFRTTEAKILLIKCLEQMGCHEKARDLFLEGEANIMRLNKQAGLELKSQYFGDL